MKKTVKVNGSWQGGFRVDLTSGNHEMIIDQPKSGGGNDEGPSSLQALLFALGGCLGGVAVIIARQERIDLRRFDLEIEADVDYDNLMGKTKEGRAGFTEIRISVDIDADMTDEEKLDFIHRVDVRCPVSDNLMKNTTMKFDLQ